jgi:hypothetical protein
LQSFPLPCCLVPHRPKYLPQHPILEHLQPMFFPQCERWRFATIKERQNFMSVYLNHHIFGWQTGRQNILHLMMASTPWLLSTLNFFMKEILIC